MGLFYFVCCVPCSACTFDVHFSPIPPCSLQRIVCSKLLHLRKRLQGTKKRRKQKQNKKTPSEGSCAPSYPTVRARGGAPSQPPARSKSCAQVASMRLAATRRHG